MATMKLMDPPQDFSDRWDLPDLLLVPMDSLDAYLTRIQQIPLLTPAEERHWGTLAHSGNVDAATYLAVHNLRYPAHLVQRWEHFPRSETVWALSDAIQAGNLGLWTAAKKFDPQVARFTTYATWWIRQAWNRARLDFLWQMRLPAHAAEEWIAYRKATEAWTQTHGTPPSPEELADQLHWSLDQVAFWQTWAETAHHPLSLDAPVGNDTETTLIDWLERPDEAVWNRMESVLRQEAVDRLLATLSTREADVLRLRFGLTGAPQTLQAIGEILRVSRERVRQIEVKALAKLRTVCDAHPEYDYHSFIET